MRYARIFTLVARIASRLRHRQLPSDKLGCDGAPTQLETGAIMNANILANLPESDRYIIVCLEKSGASLCAARRCMRQTSE